MKSVISSGGVLLAIAVISLHPATMASSQAGTILVSNTNDTGPGSLRAALATAVNGDTIDASSVTGVINLSNGQLFITNSVNIVGPGPASLVLDGSPKQGILLFVGPGKTVTVSGMAMKHGDGGTIYIDHSDATISNCTFTGSTASTGAGIFYSSSDRATGTLTVVACTISNNFALSGGGIYLFAGRFGYLTATIRDCIISGNSASRGGGLFVDANTFGIALVSIENSLLSRNSVDAYGGAIYNDGSDFGQGNLHLLNTTISGNHANLGGGIYGDNYLGDTRLTIANCTFSENSAVFGGGIFNTQVGGKFQMDIGNTILKAGDSGENLGIESGVPVNSHGYNLCSDSGNGHLAALGDQINTDPLLGPLQDNGGSTFTHALLCGSPAIDRGRHDTVPGVTSATDQRGSLRVVDDPGVTNAPGGDGSDIGAFEIQGTGLPRARGKNVEVSAGSNCTAVASIDAGSSKADRPCDTLALSQTPAGPYTLGETPVTLTVTDPFGNSNSTVATVKVIDNTPPTIQCPSNITVIGCTATGVVLGTPITSDNCSVASLVNDAPAEFPIGTNTVTWTVTDGSGNSNICLQLVIVRENTPPNITCPADVTISSDAGQCSASSVALAQPIVSDNCAGATTRYAGPSSLLLGTNVVTWITTDTSGNTNACQQTVIVADLEKPTVVCQHDFGVPATSSAGAPVTFPPPLASDNCSVATINSFPATGSIFPIGATTVTNTVTDAAGNAATCTFTVHVRVTGSQSFSFAPATKFGISGSDFALVTDLNNDGNSDVVTCGSGSFTVLLGDGNGGFPTNQAFGGNFILTAVAASDINNDGCLDLAVVDASLGEMHTYLATNCWYSSRTSMSVPAWTLSVTSADFNENGHPDHAIVSRSGSMSVMLSDGNGGLLAAPFSTFIGSEPDFIEAADLDKDGHTDLVVACRTSKRAWFFYGNGDGTFTKPSSCRVAYDARFLAVGDLNNDGLLDVAVAGFDSLQLTVLIQKKPRHFSKKTYQGGSGPLAVAIGDVNCDGFADIVTANYYDSVVAIYAGVGKGRFVPANSFVVGVSAYCVRVADFNSDGRPDIIATGSDSLSLLLNRCDSP